MTEETTYYHYVIVRADLPLDDLIINVAHAAGESVIEAPIPKTTRLVLLQVPDERALVAEAARASGKGWEVAVVFEPDPPYDGQAMAFALTPSPRRNQLRKHFYHFDCLDFKALTDAYGRLAEAELAAVKGGPSDPTT